MNAKKKLFFIHLGKLSNNSGHTARLRFELSHIAKDSDVFILSLANQNDYGYIQKYPNIRFEFLPIEFDGWEVKNKILITELIYTKICNFKPNIVVLWIEIWDLIMGLRGKLSKKIPFVTICHAMPFLGSPLKPSKSFDLDVNKYLQDSISQYKKEYIKKHHKELKDVLSSNLLVANNTTVSFYLENYYPNIKFWKQVPHVTCQPKTMINGSKINFDFCYMARIEKGKGLEFIKDILISISKIKKRKINFAILGKTYDEFSENLLLDLLKSKNNFFNIKYLGWADDQVKTEVLSRTGCFIYPSIYDNFPTVVNEALSFGLPVVLWNTIFYKTNYIKVKSVSTANMFDINQFALIATNLLESKNKLVQYSLKYIELMGNPVLTAKDDLKLFEKIIKQREITK